MEEPHGWKLENKNFNISANKNKKVFQKQNTNDKLHITGKKHTKEHNIGQTENTLF